MRYLATAAAVIGLAGAAAPATAATVRHCGYDNSITPNRAAPSVGGVTTNANLPCSAVDAAVRAVQDFAFTLPGTVDVADRLWLVSSLVHQRSPTGVNPYLVVTMRLVYTQRVWTTSAYWIRFIEGS
jgi:hypothetical protein